MLLTDIFEGKIAYSSTGMATAKIVSYLEKKLGEKLRNLGIENFANSKSEGWGERFQIGDTLKCIRLNWIGKKSSSIESVDFWLGNKKDPNFNIVIQDTSFAKALPALATVLMAPKIGEFKVEDEVALTEAKKGEFTERSAINDMIDKLEQGRSFNRSEFIMNYHPENAHAYDDWVKENESQLVVSGKRISLAKGAKLKTGTSSKTQSKDEGSVGTVVVTAGGSGEEYKGEDPDVDDHVTYSESLEHLEGLAQGLIKGSFNALFVAGKGGTGKTQTIEQVLADNGLKDNAGYFKITGSASPIGIYSALYKYKDDIILFDDCDGALESQDGRNIIKAATDTKKIRKIAWGKKSAGMYDPDSPAETAKADARAIAAADNEADEDEMDDDPDDRIPRYFNFTGQVIFISNLPLNKLDPDGALRTRAFIISINPTPDEMLARMSEILHKIPLEGGLSLTSKERTEVLDVIKASRRKDQASLRTLVRALNLAASGSPQWRKLVSLYA